MNSTLKIIITNFVITLALFIIGFSVLVAKLPLSANDTGNYSSVKNITVEESDVTEIIEKATPSVVSIVITKNVPTYENYYDSPFGSDPFFENFFNLRLPQKKQSGTEKREVGGGSGFIISDDGLIITNKHVVFDEEAEYSVILDNGDKYDAQILGRDPVNDIAVIKIDAQNLPVLPLSDSDQAKIGQTVIAIGNVLGEFNNSVSKGIISGLARSIHAGGAGFGMEELTNIIQTDAAINPGNSGGPLLDISGSVIGVNTAIADGAENIGFAIPINDVKNIIDNVIQNGRIVRPWLGVRYVLLNEEIARKNNLETDQGALILRGEQRTDLAVVPGSPADKAGLEENDIILEVEGKKIDSKNNLSKVLSDFNPGDQVHIKVLHEGEEKEVTVILEERKE